MPERIITSGCEGNHFSIAILFWDFHRAQATPAKTKRPSLYDIFSLLDNQPPCKSSQEVGKLLQPKESLTQHQIN
jgi:hypothetical protein